MSDGLIILSVWLAQFSLATCLLFLFFRMRHSISELAFAVLFTVLMYSGLAVFFAGVELRASTGGGITIILPSYIGFIFPCITMILLAYIVQGVSILRRLSIIIFVSLGSGVLVLKLLIWQFDWIQKYVNIVGEFDRLRDYFSVIWTSVLLAVIASLLLMLWLPMCYTLLRRLNCSRLLGVFCTLLVGNSLSIFSSMLVIKDGEVLLGNAVRFIWIFPSQIILVIISTFLIYAYLRWIENENRQIYELPIIDVITGLFGFNRNKQLEKRAHEWEKRHRLIMESSSDMVMLMDRNGIINDANQATLQILHFQSVAYLRDLYISQELSLICESLWQRLVVAENPPKTARKEITLQTMEGSEVIIDAIISVISLYDSPMLLLVGRNITEESKLAAKHADLAAQVAHLQQLEALGQLTGGIAHDFNNYIHAILGHVDLLELKFNIDDPAYKERLQKIVSIAEQAAKLTEQLLGFARKGKYQIVEVNLSELVADSVELFLPTKIQNVDLQVDVGKYPLPVKGDLTQLRQVMLNILFNAIDAMKKNPSSRPPSLKVSCGEAVFSPIPPEPPVTLKRGRSVVRNEDYFFLLVEDNGCGMDKNTLKNALNPFFTTKPVGEGTGMGLSMVYGAVTNHYGWIQIKSKIDIGIFA